VFLSEDKEEIKKKILSAYVFSKPDTHFAQVIDKLGLEVGITLVDELYEDYKKEVIDEEFFTSRKKRVDDRQKEVKERLAELEEDRELHDDKMGKAVRILDGLKNWEQIWNEADADKKRSLVNLMTIKVITSYKKGQYKGKAYQNKQLRIVFTSEIEELFTIGLLEAEGELKKEDPNYGMFNSPNFRYSYSDH